MSRLIVFFALIACLLPAQEFRSTLTGRVTDPSGGVVAGAKVAAIEESTNTRYDTVTNADGLPGRSQLLMDMAEVMAERETIWLPFVRFEDRQALITDLGHAGRDYGLYYLLRGLAVAPAALAGGWVWQHNPGLPFMIAGALGLVGTCLYLIRSTGTAPT